MLAWALCRLRRHDPYVDMDADRVLCRRCGRPTQFRRCRGCRRRLTPEESYYYGACCEGCEQESMALLESEGLEW